MFIDPVALRSNRARAAHLREWVNWSGTFGMHRTLSGQNQFP
jgi:hypothetical protein